MTEVSIDSLVLSLNLASEDGKKYALNLKAGHGGSLSFSLKELAEPGPTVVDLTAASVDDDRKAAAEDSKPIVKMEPREDAVVSLLESSVDDDDDSDESYEEEIEVKTNVKTKTKPVKAAAKPSARPVRRVTRRNAAAALDSDDSDGFEDMHGLSQEFF